MLAHSGCVYVLLTGLHKAHQIIQKLKYLEIRHI